MDWDSIKFPTLIIDEKKIRQNIHRIATKAANSNVVFRPHFKTHQSRTIGTWFRENQVKNITVSSVRMAEYFSTEWDDITIAIPVNTREISNINKLAEVINLNLLLESKYTAKKIESSLIKPVNVFVEIDVGYGRTGLLWNDFKNIIDLLNYIKSCKKLKLKGILTHAGQTYNTKTKEEIIEIYHETSKNLIQLKEVLNREGFPNLIISVGDTPTASTLDSFPYVHEIRPGNMVFFDLQQGFLGSCHESDIAMCIACPIIAKYPARNEIVIYGGAIHLSKDYIETLIQGNIQKIYGKIALPTESGWTESVPNAYIRSISQEHGIISVNDSKLMENLAIGDVILILPVHSCLTADLYSYYLTLDNKKIERLRLI